VLQVLCMDPPRDRGPLRAAAAGVCTGRAAPVHSRRASRGMSWSRTPPSISRRPLCVAPPVL